MNIGDVGDRILDLVDVGRLSRLPVVRTVDGKDVMVTQLMGGEEAVGQRRLSWPFPYCLSVAFYYLFFRVLR